MLQVSQPANNVPTAVIQGKGRDKGVPHFRLGTSRGSRILGVANLTLGIARAEWVGLLVCLTRRLR
jgi:hypothetical protein